MCNYGTEYGTGRIDKERFRLIGLSNDIRNLNAI
jgi:hypothetical protein